MRSSSASRGTSWKDGTPLTVTMTGSSWHKRPYWLRWALASLKGISFMVFRILLPLHEQRLAALLRDEDDRHHPRRRIDREQNPVLAEQPKLAAGDGIRPQRLHLASLGQRVFLQPLE